jgi:hypothetical protein
MCIYIVSEKALIKHETNCKDKNGNAKPYHVSIIIKSIGDYIMCLNLNDYRGSENLLKLKQSTGFLIK